LSPLAVPPHHAATCQVPLTHRVGRHAVASDTAAAAAHHARAVYAANIGPVAEALAAAYPFI
jgi:hypothetical protein